MGLLSGNIHKLLFLLLLPTRYICTIMSTANTVICISSHGAFIPIPWGIRLPTPTSFKESRSILLWVDYNIGCRAPCEVFVRFS